MGGCGNIFVSIGLVPLGGVWVVLGSGVVLAAAAGRAAALIGWLVCRDSDVA